MAQDEILIDHEKSFDLFMQSIGSASDSMDQFEIDRMRIAFFKGGILTLISLIPVVTNPKNDASLPLLFGRVLGESKVFFDQELFNQIKRRKNGQREI